MRQLFDDLVNSVNAGKALSEAMAEHREVFSPLYLSMIRVGEPVESSSRPVPNWR